MNDTEEVFKFDERVYRLDVLMGCLSGHLLVWLLDFEPEDDKPGTLLERIALHVVGSRDVATTRDVDAIDKLLLHVLRPLTLDLHDPSAIECRAAALEVSKHAVAVEQANDQLLDSLTMLFGGNAPRPGEGNGGEGGTLAAGKATGPNLWAAQVLKRIVQERALGNSPSRAAIARELRNAVPPWIWDARAPGVFALRSRPGEKASMAVEAVAALLTLRRVADTARDEATSLERRWGADYRQGRRTKYKGRPDRDLRRVGAALLWARAWATWAMGLGRAKPRSRREREALVQRLHGLVLDAALDNPGIIAMLGGKLTRKQLNNAITKAREHIQAGKPLPWDEEGRRDGEARALPYGDPIPWDEVRGIALEVGRVFDRDLDVRAAT